MGATVRTKNGALNISIARMSEHDLLEVVEIEESCGLSPWGWDSYYRELNSSEDVMMLVARISDRERLAAEGKRIAGFIVSRVAAHELHVNNVAIRSEYQRLGIASRLLNATLEQGARMGAKRAFLEVRASNRAAQKLYQRCGFGITMRRRRYYSDPVEDALIMAVALKPKP